jgi:hypothetical protein
MWRMAMKRDDSGIVSQELILKMEAALSSKMLVSYRNTTLHHNSKRPQLEF